MKPERGSGIYQPGEKIVWDVKVNNDSTGTITTATYNVKEADARNIGQGTLTFQAGTGTIETALPEPGTVLLVLRTPDLPDHKGLWAFGGAVVAYDKIDRSAPTPDDFDAFWKSKLDALRAVPPNPVLEKVDSGKPGVDYWKITLDNINGTHVYGQLARPSGDKKAPAMLIMQWAGVYPLNKQWVTDRAAEGWLVLNVMAHDLPIDQPIDFYKRAEATTIKGYPGIGQTDRDKSYFLRMFLGDVRAADYLAQRPDWDGNTLVATGGSQGGWQSFAAAALNPKITAVIANVPAGCDHSGQLAGRVPGWPFFLKNLVTPEQKDTLATALYFDSVNFAARIKCPALVGVGLIDTIAPPAGVFAAFNQLQGPKEICIMPTADHEGHFHSQADYETRAAEWCKAMAGGGSVPPPAKR